MKKLELELELTDRNYKTLERAAKYLGQPLARVVADLIDLALNSKFDPDGTPKPPPGQTCS